MRLFQPRTIWWPTWTGALLLGGLGLGLTLVLLLNAERFLDFTDRQKADVLVVEGWIGREGMQAAANEFRSGNYRFIVAAGGLTSGRWEDHPTSYAQMAASELLRDGIPPNQILLAEAKETESRRTYESAVAVQQAINQAGLTPTAVNVFTLGPHARRSELVFQKVMAGGTKLGVIGWVPADYRDRPWWQSSERARDLFEEIFGYVYELLLNSGRHASA